MTRDTSDRRPSAPRRILAAALALVFEFAACVVGSAGAQDEPRTASGRPDFTGTYDAATVSPLERPVELADQLTLTTPPTPGTRHKA